MNELPGDPALPPGVTDKDIERPEPKECTDCDGEGYIQHSPCCGARISFDAEIDPWPSCTKCHKDITAEEMTCERCHGEGVVEDDPA